MIRMTSAPGKLILSGEYSVVFGAPGIAIPAKRRFSIEREDGTDWVLQWTHDPGPEWKAYAEKLAHLCGDFGAKPGTLRLKTDLPLGKGMGSSTSLVVAMARATLEADRETALALEDVMNPGHSGLDFTVIWEEKPLVFRKGHQPEALAIDLGFLEASTLIDTGTPGEATPVLVDWVRSRLEELEEPLETIHQCTERLLGGESPLTVFPDHHRAQVALGVVPAHVQELVSDIEKAGGAAKVVGAGGRTGGGGIVLALHTDPHILSSLSSPSGCRRL